MSKLKGTKNKKQKSKAQILKHKKNMAVGFDKPLSIAEHDKLFNIDADMRKALNDPKGWKSGTVSGMSIRSKNDAAIVEAVRKNNRATNKNKRIVTEDGKHNIYESDAS